MKVKISILLLLFFLIGGYFYLSSLEYRAYEITADNYKELERSENANYYYYYEAELQNYYGFRNIQFMKYDSKDDISKSDHKWAKFSYFTAIENDKSKNIYHADLADCSRLIVNYNEKKKIHHIIQVNVSKLCKAKFPLFDERIQFIINKGFVKKESNLKNGASILIKENDKKFFHIIEIKEYNDEILSLSFELYNKKKYPSLSFFNNLTNKLK